MSKLSHPTAVSKACVRLIACISLSFAAVACSQVVPPMGTHDSVAPLDLTGAIKAAPDKAADVDGEDRRIIARSIENALAQSRTGSSQTVSWANPVSGNTGTISDIDNGTASLPGCVHFKTTANTISGVRAYEGQACRDAVSNLTVTGLSEAS